MIYDQNDKNRTLSFYDNLIAENGIHTPQALSWISDSTQGIRFAVLCGVGNISKHSVLDMGCGFGDLYEFLGKNFQGFSYYGIDIHQKMIEAARTKHPTVKFDVMDFGNYTGAKFDYIVSSGALSFKVPDYKKLYFDHIQKMFEYSNTGVAFNMLNGKYHKDDETFTAYTIPEVYEFCSTLTERIIIRQDYLVQDFTVYLYH